MNTKNYTAILIYALALVLVSSCCIHEFPDPKPKEIPFELHLSYDTEMPLYKVLEYTEETKAGAVDFPYDVRYVVNAYDADQENSREALHSFVFTKDDISELGNSVTLTIPEGSYRFVVWTDYVDEGSQEDLYYNTERFESLALADRSHEGSNDMRDAFTGSVTSEVSEACVEADVQMTRPLAKFNFITTDVRNFVARLRAASASGQDQASGLASASVSGLDSGQVSSQALVSSLVSSQALSLGQDYGPGQASASVSGQGLASSQAPVQGLGAEAGSDSSASGESTGNITSLDEYVVVFRYNGFMTSAYNLHTDRTSDSRTGVIFTSKITQLSEDEAEMGFDYMFVDDNESIISVILEVQDAQGNLISRFKPVDIPLMRSKLTTVKANFLTSDADGGVSISPDYDDEYIIVI